MTPRKLFLVVVLLLPTTLVQAQIPRFHFVGAPTLSHQHDETILMNDRVLSGHHVYDHATDTWRELTRLHAFYRTAMEAEFPDRFAYGPVYVLNDSLIGFDSMSNVSSDMQTFHIWNVNTDDLAHTGHLPDDYSSRWYKRYYFLDVAQNVVYFKLDTATSTLSLTTTPLGSDSGTSASYTFTADADIQQILARTEGGYWIIGRKTVSFTQDFSTIQDVTPVGLPISAADISRDGSTLFLISADDNNKAYHFNTLASPTDSWRTIPVSYDVAQTFSSARVDGSGALWAYEHQVEAARSGREDGFVSYSSTGVITAAQLPNRARVSSFAHSSSGWIIANTLIDLMQSTDGGTTWTILQSPLPKHILEGRVAISRDGTPVIAVAGGPALLVDVQSAQFSPLPGEYHPVEVNDQFPIYSTFTTPDVYEYEVGGSVCKIQDEWYLGDERGLAAMDRWSSARIGLWWNDTLYMHGHWGENAQTKRYSARIWIPGDLRDTAGPGGSMYLTSPIMLSNGVFVLGGSYNKIWFTTTGRLEDVSSWQKSGYCSGYPAAYDGEIVWAKEANDSIYVLMRSYAGCSDLYIAPINDLRSFKQRRVNLNHRYQWLRKGHDGLLYQYGYSNGEYDSISIYSPDLMSKSIVPFDGITEKKVLDLAYDERNKVYYATTERGLYRSDPVVTSVEEVVQRPASEITLHTSWYNTLGEQVHVPSVPGLYLKITFDGSGSYRTEKIVLTE